MISLSPKACMVKQKLIVIYKISTYLKVIIFFMNQHIYYFKSNKILLLNETKIS